MISKKMWWAVLFTFLARVVVADNDFTFTGTPVAGQPFNITWIPGTYSQVDILLNTLYPSQQAIITTSALLATEIDNTGSWVWNVPADIQGRYSLSIARDFRFAVSYSAPFVFGPYSISSALPPDTSIPQSTACTSATSSIPSPTGVNPFIFPSGDAFHVRVGIQSTLEWIPTTPGTLSIILKPGDSPVSRANISIASQIPNSGSYLWTPAADLADNGFPLYSYEIVLIDDADPSLSSTSETIEVLSPSYETDFTGPYIPAVLGQPFQIKWSPSTTPTISLVLQEDISANPPPNATIGSHIPNSGSYTWQVPASSTFVVPGVWWLAAIDDTTGNLDARIQITIDATSPPTCGSDSATNSSPTTTSAVITGTNKTAATAATATSSPTSGSGNFTVLNSVAFAASTLSSSASASASISPSMSNAGQQSRPAAGQVSVLLVGYLSRPRCC